MSLYLFCFMYYKKYFHWFNHFGDQLVEWSWNVTWRMDLKVYVWCVQMKHQRVITQPCTSPQLCGAFYLLSGHLFAFYTACLKGFGSLWLCSASFLQILSGIVYEQLCPCPLFLFQSLCHNQLLLLSNVSLVCLHMSFIQIYCLFSMHLCGWD